jgi:DNA-binding transcriptional ArsR family regulator/precorrin-6B methylase 2
MGSPEQLLGLKALADSTRLRLLRLLYHEELNVYELCQILNMPQPRISRHLAVLRKAGLVSDRREGAKVYYALAEPEGDTNAFRSYLTQLGESAHSDLEQLDRTLKARVQHARSFADSKADQWDDIGKVLHSPSAGLLAAANLVPRNLTIADLGTGTGLLLPLLASMAKQVYAVDQSAAMLRRARLRCREAGIANVEFIQRQLEELSAEQVQCDAALLHFVMHQVARPPQLIKHLSGLLRPEGRLVIVDRVQHEDERAKTIFGSLWLGFKRQQVELWFSEAGLSDITWRTLSGADPSTDTPFPVFVAAATAPGIP